MEAKSAQTVDIINRTTVFIRLPIGGYSYAGSRQTDGRTDGRMDGQRRTETDGRTDRQAGGQT